MLKVRSMSSKQINSGLGCLQRYSCRFGKSKTVSLVSAFGIMRLEMACQKPCLLAYLAWLLFECALGTNCVCWCVVVISMESGQKESLFDAIYDSTSVAVRRFPASSQASTPYG